MNLTEICTKKLEERGLDDPKFLKRLNDEIYEIEAQAEQEYFLELYRENKKFSENEHNLLVPYLLDLVPEVDVDREFAYDQGEFPDIDIDFLTEVRDYLKLEWAPQQFGAEKVCSISTYGTLGIKSAITDMARIYGYDVHEVKGFTTKMEDKDDEGKDLEWDKALELYPDFKAYCSAHSDVADAAKMLLERYRSNGVHAGGLIISNQPISNFVPLEIRGKDENPVVVAAWTEGQATQDLQPVGLIKFDLLVVDGLKLCGLAIKLIQERYGIANVCARPGGRSWSDNSYIHDPKALELANRGDLKAIFQCDSEVVRRMAMTGGVDRFDDLPAYSSINRPGPLSFGVDKSYCDRKQGREEYSLHPLIQPILGKTYGLMIYQEQIMQLLHVVGGIPLIHCEKARKAISKKNEEGFIKYKEQFLRHGREKHGFAVSYLEELWDQMQAFSGYGFNRCVTGDMRVLDKISGESFRLDDLAEQFKSELPPNLKLDSWLDGKIVEDEVIDVFFVREDEVMEIELDNGMTIKCTKDHKFLCSDGEMHEMQEIIEKDLEMLSYNDT